MINLLNKFKLSLYKLLGITLQSELEEKNLNSLSQSHSPQPTHSPHSNIPNRNILIKELEKKIVLKLLIFN